MLYVSHMLGERGPKKKRHLPTYSGGCYRNRIGDCCWLCMSRIAGTQLRDLFRTGGERAAVRTHELIGEDVEVPVVGDDGESVEHLPGEIVDVFDDEPSVFAVRLENGTRLAFSIEHLG